MLHKNRKQYGTIVSTRINPRLALEVKKICRKSNITPGFAFRKAIEIGWLTVKDSFLRG